MSDDPSKLPQLPLPFSHSPNTGNVLQNEADQLQKDKANAVPWRPRQTTPVPTSVSMSGLNKEDFDRATKP